MPKDLFFKLPPEKQQKILDAAEEEFLAYKDNYKKSSVNRIAEKADIAIGSIYKYFCDKNDLFMYLFNQHKSAPASQPESDTCFDYAGKEILASKHFTPTGEALLEIISDTPALFHNLIFKDAAGDDYTPRINAYLQKDQARGYLRDALDKDVAAYLYSSLEYIAYQYCLSRGIDVSNDTDILWKMTELFFFGLYKDGIEDEIR